MKKENNIDTYFSRVKQNPPLMDIEKVHQILTEVKTKIEVEAEVEVEVEVEAKAKKGRRNLLKFTIMTTIFAVIISAVLLWSGEDSKESSIKSQDIRPAIKLDVSDSRFQIEPLTHVSDSNGTDFSDAGITDINANNEFIAKSRKASSPITSNHSVVYPMDQNLPDKIAEMNTPLKKHLDFNPNTIQPTDGSRFILKLSNEELIKIGFEVSDTSYNYKQQVDTTQFHYCFHTNRSTAFKIDADGKMLMLENEPKITYGHTEFGFSSYCSPKLSADLFDFYPVYKTNLFFSEISNNQKLTKEAFSMANDTLLAVVLPVSNLIPTIQDKLIWFTTSEKFYAALSPEHKAVVEEFKKYKAAKKAWPSKDLIVYQPPKLFDESKVVVLTKDELGKLGFRFYTDSTIYKGNTRELEVEYYKSLSASRVTYSQGLSLKQYTNILAVMVTRTDGSPYANLDQSSILIKMDDKKYGEQFPLLIPV